MRRFMLALTGPGAGSVPGVTPAPDPGATATVNLVNYSGASRTNPYFTFSRFFIPGVVPTGSYVDLKQGGSSLAVQQAAARSYYDDGSLKSAVFTGKDEGGARSDNAAFTVDLTPTVGSFTDTTSIARSTLTGRDLKIRCKIGGTNYYLLLNNADTAGNYEARLSGPGMVCWHHWGVLRNGQGGSDTDHGQLQGRLYSEVFSNGDIRVWAQVINGRVATGQAYTVDELELLDGAASLVSFTTDFSLYNHNKVDLLGTDALPVWVVGSATHIHAKATPEYLSDTKLLPWIENTPTMIAAIGSGSAIDYTPNSVGDVGDINSGGGNPWIGVVPAWSAQAIVTNDKTRVRNDRVNALAQNVKSPVWFIDATTGQPAVLVDTNYSGMPNGDSTQAWGNGTAPQGGSTGGGVSGGSADFSHKPHYAYTQYLMTGHPAWLDALLMTYVGDVGWNNRDTGVNWSRNPLINSVNYYGVGQHYSQSREQAWASWQASCLAWTINDGHKAYAYAQALRTAQFAAIEAFLTTPNADATWATLGIWPGQEGTATNSTAVKPWMQNYRAIAMMMAYYRDHISSSHKGLQSVAKWNIGLVNACAYHIVGSYTVGIRAAIPPSSSDPFAEDFNDVGVGEDGGTDPATGVTIKLVSDSGGVSGSCPASGMDPTDEQFGVGHAYPTIYRCVTSLASGLGLTGGSTADAKLAAIETTAALSESDWGGGYPQWRLRFRAVGG